MPDLINKISLGTCSQLRCLFAALPSLQSSWGDSVTYYIINDDGEHWSGDFFSAGNPPMTVTQLGSGVVHLENGEDINLYVTGKDIGISLALGSNEATLRYDASIETLRVSAYGDSSAIVDWSSTSKSVNALLYKDAFGFYADAQTSETSAKIGGFHAIDLRLGSGNDTIQFREPVGYHQGAIWYKVDAGAGNDVIKMSGLNDYITGGAGNDKMWGGGGEDFFFFDNTKKLGNDVIYDFGADDVVLTTVEIFDSNRDGVIGFGKNNQLDLGSGSKLKIIDDGNMAVHALAFQGTVEVDGVNYFSYSLIQASL